MKLVNCLHVGQANYGAVTDTCIVGLDNRLKAAFPRMTFFIGSNALTMARISVDTELGDLDCDRVELL
jgi:hypothetical protein